MHHWHINAENPTQCPKCGGLLALLKDHFDFYIHCLQCGLHLFPMRPDVHITPDTRGQPRTQHGQERHRELGDAIATKGLSAKDATLQLGISRSTYYRVKAGRRTG